MPILIIVLVHRSLTIPLPCMSCSTNTTQLSQRTLDFRQKFKTEVPVGPRRSADTGTNAGSAPSTSS
jgi:penicillin V acylase-like amidase (Ntn superfamily)